MFFFKIIPFKYGRKSCRENIEENQVVKSIEENHEEKILKKTFQYFEQHDFVQY